MGGVGEALGVLERSDGEWSELAAVKLGLPPLPPRGPVTLTCTAAGPAVRMRDR